MKQITEEYRIIPLAIRTRLEDGERASVNISADYFESGDYTHWQENDDEFKDAPYGEYVYHLIEEMQSKYDFLRLYSTGELYGVVGGTSHDISYNEFDDFDTFFTLAEEYGIEGTLELYPGVD